MKITTCVLAVSIFLLWFQPSAEANTYRHIYNESSCSVEFEVNAKKGNMYCNGGKNSFTVTPGTSPEYELTTTGGISYGTFIISNAKQSVGVEYLFGSGVMSPVVDLANALRPLNRGGNTFSNIFISDCDHTVKIVINSPAAGDVVITNDKELPPDQRYIPFDPVID